MADLVCPCTRGKEAWADSFDCHITTGNADSQPRGPRCLGEEKKQRK